MNRRKFTFSATALAVSCMWTTRASHAAGEPAAMSAPEALKAATNGDVVLVDIRTRQEWQQTGLAQPALPISMHEGGFVQKLLQATAGDRSRPVAIICATGGRTRYLQNVLAGAGFTNIIDVPEGMMGSPAGPGWLKRSLPVKAWKAN